MAMQQQRFFYFREGAGKKIPGQIPILLKAILQAKFA